MARYLYNKYTDYGRLKFKVFKKNVDEGFNEFIKNSVNEEKEKPSEKTEPIAIDSSSDSEIQAVEQTKVTNTNMNNTITDLYATPKTDFDKIKSTANLMEKSLSIPKKDVSSTEDILVVSSPKLVDEALKENGINPIENSEKKENGVTVAEKLERPKETPQLIELEKSTNNNTEKKENVTKAKTVVPKPTEIIEVKKENIRKSTEKKKQEIPKIIELDVDPPKEASPEPSIKSTRSLSPISKPSKKKKVEVAFKDSKVCFKDVAGLDDKLEEFLDIVQALELDPHSTQRSVLFHGPPGCGKTLLANAICGELKWPMLDLTATDIVSGISGESEAKLRSLFDQATNYNQKCVVFIDDIEVIAQKKDNSSSIGRGKLKY